MSLSRPHWPCKVLRLARSKLQEAIMRHTFTALLTSLALAATIAPSSAQHAAQPPDVIDVVIAGAPQTRYAHQGRWYVEARKGREYAIRIRNPFGVRAAVALSVDGLNTIDARHTSAAGARKWVLDPYETITISGWQTSRTEARRFEFVTEENSYGQALGKTNDLGLITAVFFRERVTPVAREREERPAPHPAAPAAASREPRSAADAGKPSPDTEALAATGMGRATTHQVTQVWLNLERSPALSVDVRYEFRPQLVKLGILPQEGAPGALNRRERARGFETGFSPVPDRFR
jgi:hypothetical protein